MARSAASRSFSLRSEEVPRFDGLVERMANGSPTEFVRRAMDRMEALENWQLFLEVREIGLRRAYERGGSTPEQRRAAVKRALNPSSQT
ncbi:MAG TPA: hypothetical protein VG015_03435 [Candidatus Dormibacteraeota bacterium]|jgi:hypothetical protein|nr:hypothetical protein [Candidatus Dormibacteraeota bacterium]